MATDRPARPAGDRRSALAALRRFDALARADERRRDACARDGGAARGRRTGREFIAAVEAITGVPVALLSGAEEARLTALGVISGIHEPDGIAGDLGGGSLEVVDVRKGEDRRRRDLSARRPAARGSLREDASRRPRRSSPRRSPSSKVLEQAARSGPSTPSAAPGGRWPGCTCGRRAIRCTSCTTTRSSRTRRSTSAAWSPGATSTRSIRSRSCRATAAPLLPYGALVLEQVIKVMRPSEIVMSALGVREGHLYDLLSAEEKARDPLIVACEELAYLRSRSPRHVAELGAVVGHGVRRRSASTRPRRKRGCAMRGLPARRYRLARPPRISRRAEPQPDRPRRLHRHRPSRPRLSGARQLLSARGPDRRRAVAAHPRARVDALIERARALGATLRVAYLISGAMPGVVGRTRIMTTRQVP